LSARTFNWHLHGSLSARSVGWLVGSQQLAARSGVGVSHAGFWCISDDDGRAAEQAINSAIQHLQRVTSAWSRVLPANAATHGAGQSRF